MINVCGLGFHLEDSGGIVAVWLSMLSLLARD